MWFEIQLDGPQLFSISKSYRICVSYLLSDELRLKTSINRRPFYPRMKEEEVEKTRALCLVLRYFPLSQYLICYFHILMESREWASANDKISIHTHTLTHTHRGRSTTKMANYFYQTKNCWFCNRSPLEMGDWIENAVMLYYIYTKNSTMLGK